MKFEEVLPALREGKKIRKTSWWEGHYFELAGDEIVDQDGKNFTFGKEDLLCSDWEIFKKKMKIKLRDLTYEQFEKWQCKNCDRSNCYKNCPFGVSDCWANFWILHKDMFSDKFLDQEIEVEVDD